MFILLCHQQILGERRNPISGSIGIEGYSFDAGRRLIGKGLTPCQQFDTYMY